MAAHVPGGLERDAEASEGPLAQDFPVVADITAADPDRTGLPGCILVLPGATEVRGKQAVVLDQLGGRSRRAMAAEVFGACAHHTPVGRELARGERGVGQCSDA